MNLTDVCPVVDSFLSSHLAKCLYSIFRAVFGLFDETSNRLEPVKRSVSRAECHT